MAKTSTLSSSSSTISSTKGKIFTSLGSLIKLLPTGTMFLFQFLSPVLTNNGDCNPRNMFSTGTLLGFCGISCFLSTFTDSYKDYDGTTHYGIATPKGLWSISKTSVDLSAYKLRFGDFVHAFLSLLVFAVVAFVDNNIIGCFYSSFECKFLLQVLPPAIGSISGVVFVVFPNTRHGIGYPLSSSSCSSVYSA